MLFLKSIYSYVPGISDIRYGNLIKTSEILEKIKASDDFDTNFVSRRIGIDSVSAFLSTIEDFNGGKVHFNSEMYQALSEIVDIAIEDQEERNFIAHIHIGSAFEMGITKHLKMIGTRHGIVGVPILIQSGCAGIIDALKLASDIIDARGIGSVLITGENNMLLHGRHRRTRYADKRDINNWLWPTIFGDGVGAMVVSNDGSRRLKIQKEFTVAQGPRVTDVIRADGSYGVKILAKEVSQTYTEGITSCLSDFDLNHFEKVLLHESNPRLVRNMSRSFDIPVEKSYSISSKSGTLACISGFTLIQEAFSKNKSALVALIGETGDSVKAGVITVGKSDDIASQPLLTERDLSLPPQDIVL